MGSNKLPRLAVQIHDLADELREEVWGDKDLRQPPIGLTQDSSRLIQIETPTGNWVYLDPSAWSDDQSDHNLAKHLRYLTGLRVTITRTTRTTA